MSITGTALSGMQASMVRLNASASNIANANSTGPVPETPPSQPVARNSGQTGVYQAVTVQQGEVSGGGVYSSLGTVTPSYVERYDPSSPQANAEGMVAAPNVDVVGELVDQAAARIAFEANLRVLETGGRTDKSILEIWA